MWPRFVSCLCLSVYVRVTRITGEEIILRYMESV